MASDRQTSRTHRSLSKSTQVLVFMLGFNALILVAGGLSTGARTLSLTEGVLGGVVLWASAFVSVGCAILVWKYLLDRFSGVSHRD